MQYYIYNGELCHYGVLGMRWGVRRNSSRAFKRASKKAERIDKKEAKNRLKAAKYHKKATDKLANATSAKKIQKGFEIQAKGNKYELKSAKLNKKGQKWATSMSQEFANVKRSDIKPEHLEVGRKYAHMLSNG